MAAQPFLEPFVLATPQVARRRWARSNPPIAATATEFLETASKRGAAVELIQVPDGHHSFDILDHTEQSRDAVERAMSWVATALVGDGTDR